MAIQIKRGTSAQRKVSEVVLEAGQPFLETDTGNLFIGKTGTEKLKDLTLYDSYPSLKTLRELGLLVDPKRRIYGVDRVGSQDPNALVRTDAAQGLNITVGTSEITSDFDDYYPWSNIEEITGDVGNVFVKIPKFYSKITKNADGTYKHQLSGTKHEGFDTLFKVGTKEIDYVMVGKYEGSGSSSRVFSRSGETPLTNITMDDFRIGCKANGAGYQQYDFLIDLIIKELWLVEMATTNCNSIMNGFMPGNDNRPLNTGTTDSVSTSSGSPVSNTDGKHACKYRGIENPWGNLIEFCDGISFTSDNSVMICTTPQHYKTADTTYPYVKYGTRAASPYWRGVKVVTPLNNSLIQYVTEIGSSVGTYYCDKTVQNGYILGCSGDGLWEWNGGLYVDSKGPRIGGRLCYKPTT